MALIWSETYRASVMVVWTEERWRSHTPPRLERRRAAHRRRRGRGHKPGCWGLHTPRRLERRGAAHQLAGRGQTNNPVWGGPLAVLGLAGKGRLASFSRHSHCMAGPPSEAERPLWRQLRHGMPQQRARRTPHSTQRAAQSHRSDLVALELRGAKLLTPHERSIYAIAPPPFGRSSLGCTPATSRPRQRPSVAPLSQGCIAGAVDVVEVVVGGEGEVLSTGPGACVICMLPWALVQQNSSD